MEYDFYEFLPPPVYAWMRGQCVLREIFVEERQVRVRGIQDTGHYGGNRRGLSEDMAQAALGMGGWGRGSGGVRHG